MTLAIAVSSDHGDAPDQLARPYASFKQLARAAGHLISITGDHCIHERSNIGIGVHDFCGMILAPSGVGGMPLLLSTKQAEAFCTLTKCFAFALLCTLVL